MNTLISREAAIIALMDEEADQIQTKNGTEIIDIIQSVSTVPAIPIPDNATNGDMIKLLFPKIDKYNNMLLEEHRTNVLFDNGWWNSPYKRGETNE